jgi:hypothetical protein
LKNRRKATSLHSALLDVAGNIFPDIDKDTPTLDGKVDILAKDFWLKIPERIAGQQDEKKPGEYHSTEFGTLYKGTVGKILHDNFGVESKHTEKGNLLTFQRHTIKRLKSQLNSKIIVKTLNTLNTLKADEGRGFNNFERNGNVNSDNIEREKMTPLTHEPSAVTCDRCGERLDPSPFYAKLHKCDPLGPVL